MEEEINNQFDNNEFGSVQEPKNKKGFFVCLILIIAIIIIGAIYFLKTNVARYIFDKTIKEIASSASKEVQSYKTEKVNMDISLNVKGDELEGKKIVDFINDSKFSINTEIDNESGEAIVGLKIKNNSDKLIDASMKLSEKELFVKASDFFDKTLKIDLTEQDEFDISSLTEETVNPKAIEIFSMELKNQLNDEYFSKEMVNVDGKKLSKNVLKLNGVQAVDILKNIIEKLSKNDEFLNSYKNSGEMKESLEDALKDLEDSNASEDEFIEIDVYTSGLMNKVQRVDVIFGENDENYTIKLTKVSDEDIIYELKESSDDEMTVAGELKVTGDENNSSIEISAKNNENEVTVKMDVSIKYDEKLSNFDTSDAVLVDELSEEDTENIYYNFMESKLYEKISEITGSLFSHDYVYPEEDELSDSEQQEQKNEENTKSKLGENELKTYDDDLVKFNIPSGYNCYSNEETYKLFDKDVDDDEIEVDVVSDIGTIDEYIKDLEDDVEFYNSQENYSNAKLTDPEEIEVNGIKFKKIIFSYDYSFAEDDVISHLKTYYVTDIDDDNLYTLEIENEELMEDGDLEQFLSIEK